MLTDLKDCKGINIVIGNKCLMDSGHSHNDNENLWIGEIIFKQGNCYFKYIHNNDKVLLSNVHHLLEVQ
jgi:hypothetical protein